MTLFTTTTLVELAASLDKDPVTIAADVYKLARYLDESGNKGASRHALETVNMPVYFLTDEYAGIWRDILFHGEGSRKRDYSGWGVRRRPDWRVAWGERYGWENAIGQTLIEEAHAAALVEHESRRVKRSNETFTQGRYEDYTSEQIAYRFATSDILMRRYERLYRSRRASSDWKSDVYGYLMNVWMQQNLHMQKELEYRTKADPAPRSSKKKTEAARADFHQAQKYLDAGTGYFFSPEFVQEAIDSAEEPDLRVDFDHLPKLPADKMPVRWLTDGQLVQQFMAFLTKAESDKASFEYEDTRLIMDSLRKMFARAKGQKPDDGETIIGKETV